MSLTLPNLDDRTYDDLVEEARSLLPVFAPDLTNHNPSEPLITLTELFAYFIEILVYRTNLVTDANRLAFLRLLNGPAWEPPLPSREAVDAEIRRTVLSLRQTERAVTPADFEFLARAADARIARAHCIPGLDLETEDPALRLDPAPGHVSVVIVPFDTDDLDAVLRNVARFLEPRRLLATQIHVVGPRSVPVSVSVTLHLLPDALESAVKDRVSAALTAWFDPIAGRDGAGWPLGRSVYVSEIYRLLDRLDGVDFVTRTIDRGNTLDELTTSPEFAGRLDRNTDGELISIVLQPDELIEAQINVDAHIKIAPLQTP